MQSSTIDQQAIFKSHCDVMLADNDDQIMQNWLPDDAFMVMLYLDSGIFKMPIGN